MTVAFEHILAGPLQFPQAESPNIQIIGLKNAVDTGNQFLPSQHKGLLSVILFRTTLCIMALMAAPGLVLTILHWNYHDYTYIIMSVAKN